MKNDVPPMFNSLLYLVPLAAHKIQQFSVSCLARCTQDTAICCILSRSLHTKYSNLLYLVSLAAHKIQQFAVSCIARCTQNTAVFCILSRSLQTKHSSPLNLSQLHVRYFFWNVECEPISLFRRHCW